MFGALTQVILRDWRAHKLRLVLTVVGITLGVAVFFAIRTSNKSLVASLDATVQKLAGKATLQVVGGETGFAQDTLQKVRAVPGVLYAEPVTETVATTTLPGEEKLLILGLDTTSDPKIYEESFDQGNITVANPLAFTDRGDSVAVTRAFAQRFKLRDGDHLTIDVQGGRRDLTIRGLFSASGAGSVFDGNVAVMDIAAAQDAFGKGVRIDRIDIANASDVSVEELQHRLAEVLPPGVKAERPDMRGASLENAVSSMNAGMTIMSFLALTIGVFIIFNSFSISLNQRWRQIGILRSLGAERGNVQRMFLIEALVVGIVGSLVGVPAGFWLAQLSMRFVGGVSASFFGIVASPQALEFNRGYAIEAFAAGVVTSIVAAWLPARSASRLDPVLALHNVESRQRESPLKLSRVLFGVLFVAAGVLLTNFGSVRAGTELPLFYSFVMQFGMILLVPFAIVAGAKLLRPLLGLVGPEGVMAVDTMARSARRTAATVIALMIGLALVFSYGAFIQSLKTAIHRSIDRSVTADILVAASADIYFSQTYHFTEDTAKHIEALPEIERYDAVRTIAVDHGGESITVFAQDMNAYFDISPDLLTEGDPREARALTAAGSAMLVSTNFASRFDASIGDPVTIDTPTGPLTLKVAGILDYYRSQSGSVFFDRDLFIRYWGDKDVDHIYVDLKPGTDASVFKRNVDSLLAGQQRAFVFTHEEYKRWVSAAVDQLFALLYVQMFIAFVVAVLGLVNTMVISVSERRHELGVFRAIGGLRRQVVTLVLLEAAAISLIGLATGLAAGLLNAFFLVNAATRTVAGYTLPLIFPMSMVLAAIPVVMIVAVLSALIPARSAARLNVVDAISYE